MQNITEINNKLNELIQVARVSSDQTPYQADENGQNAAHLAVSALSRKGLALILAMAAKSMDAQSYLNWVNSKNKEGDTPLMQAVKLPANTPEKRYLVSMLLTAGARADWGASHNSEGRSLIGEAVRHTDFNVTRILRERGAVYGTFKDGRNEQLVLLDKTQLKKMNEQLLTWQKDGRSYIKDAKESAESTFSAFLDPHEETAKLDAKLTRACRAGKWEDAMTFLKQGADPNRYRDRMIEVDEKGNKVESKNEYSCLAMAVNAGRNDVVSQLIECGALVNEGPNLDDKPLHTAVLRGFTDIVKSLIQNGADPYAKFISMPENKYSMPIHLAAAYGHKDIVDYFLDDMKIDPSMTNSDQANILHIAIQRKQWELVLSLLGRHEKGANIGIDARNSGGATPLLMLAYNLDDKNVNVMQQLLSCRPFVDVNAKDNTGIVSVWRAAINRYIEKDFDNAKVIEALLTRVDVGSAVMDDERSKYLINLDLQMQSSDRNMTFTPMALLIGALQKELHHPRRKRNISHLEAMIKRLFDAGASVNAVSSFMVTKSVFGPSDSERVKTTPIVALISTELFDVLDTCFPDKSKLAERLGGSTMDVLKASIRYGYDGLIPPITSSLMMNALYDGELLFYNILSFAIEHKNGAAKQCLLDKFNQLDPDNRAEFRSHEGTGLDRAFAMAIKYGDLRLIDFLNNMGANLGEQVTIDPKLGNYNATRARLLFHQLIALEGLSNEAYAHAIEDIQKKLGVSNDDQKLMLKEIKEYVHEFLKERSEDVQFQRDFLFKFVGLRSEDLACATALSKYVRDAVDEKELMLLLGQLSLAEEKSRRMATPPPYEGPSAPLHDKQADTMTEITKPEPGKMPEYFSKEELYTPAQPIPPHSIPPVNESVEEDEWHIVDDMSSDSDDEYVQPEVSIALLSNLLTTIEKHKNELSQKDADIEQLKAEIARLKDQKSPESSRSPSPVRFSQSSEKPASKSTPKQKLD
ncbi:MAG: ankyrin repeat domain-containing protein [Gammaproteobacteria bacterium]